MRTIDHWNYAKRMVRPLHISKTEKLAFCLGCVMPDYNKFSYMGYHINDWSYGHSYAVRREEIVSFFGKAYRDSWLWWYSAGLRFHYLGDSFSRPHNPAFHYGSKEHVKYEWRLHHLTEKILRTRPFDQAAVTGSFGQWLSMRHKAYMRNSKGITDDAYYIDSTLMGAWNWVKEKVLPASATLVCS